MVLEGISKSIINTEFETLIETDMFSANEIDACLREILLMIELTSEMIVEIHDTIIQRYGGLPGILCQGTIDYLVTRIGSVTNFL